MLEPAALILSLLNSSSSSSSSSAEDFLPTSLRSGCGLALVGSVCSRQPPDDSSSRSLEFLHFIRRFWNQIFTCGQEKKRSVSEKRGSQRGLRAQMTHGACFKHMLKFFLFILFVCLFLPVSPWGPVWRPVSSCRACWCISASGTFSPRLCAARRRTPPSSASLCGVSLWRPGATKTSRGWERLTKMLK